MMMRRDADVYADVSHAVSAAAAAAVADDVANVVEATKMTSRPLRGPVYTCDK